MSLPHAGLQFAAPRQSNHTAHSMVARTKKNLSADVSRGQARLPRGTRRSSQAK